MSEPAKQTTNNDNDEHDDLQPNNPFASASLYVGDLASDVQESTLFELFNAVGPVASIRVARDGTSRKSLGYAYVNFHSHQHAQRAMDKLNFVDIHGRQCRIMWSQRDARLRQSGKGCVFVKNLPESIDNKILYDTFSKFGDILSCKVVYDKESQKSKGYGYIHYYDQKSAHKAIKGVNGMIISNCKLYAELLKPREDSKNNLNFTTVYVKYIPKHWDEATLKRIFEENTDGKIDKIQFFRNDYGVSACLNFVSCEHAKIAVEKMNNRDVSSFGVPNATEDNKNGDDKTIPKKLYVAMAQKRKERREYLSRQQQKRGTGSRRNYIGSSNLYVKNLSLDVDDNTLHEMFSKFGVIKAAKVMYEANSKSRGFGFVAFEKEEAAIRAIHEMTNTLHDGKPLYVSRAQTKSFRQSFIMKQLRNKRLAHNMDNQSHVDEAMMEQERGFPVQTPFVMNVPNPALYKGLQQQQQQVVTYDDEENKGKDERIAHVLDDNKDENKGVNQHIDMDEKSTTKTQKNEALQRQVNVLNGAFRKLRELYEEQTKQINEMKIKINKMEQYESKQDQEINELKAAINKQKPNVMGSEKHEIQKWLTDIVRLPQYIENFLIQGYDSWDIILVMNEEQLHRIGIKLPGHKFKIQQEIVKLNKKHNNNDKDNDAENQQMAAATIESWQCSICETRNVGFNTCTLCGIQY